jgi:hypothetical protein
MPTVAIQAGELSGQTGFVLYVYSLAGVLQNSGGDSLSESPSSSGRFTATVAESLSGVLYVLVRDNNGYAVREGYLEDAGTNVLPGYPSSFNAADIRTAIGLAAADLDDQLGDILTAAMTGGSGSGGSNLTTIIAADIAQNDAYDGTANNALTFAVTKNFTSGWTGTFTIRHRVTNAVLLTKSVTVSSSVLLTVSLSSTDTAFATLVDDDEFGPHPYEIQMVSGSSKQTPVTGIVTVSKDLTQ